MDKKEEERNGIRRVMLRTVEFIIRRKDSRFQVRLKCGHMYATVFKSEPSIDNVYNCQKCDIKGQGIRSGLGTLGSNIRK